MSEYVDVDIIENGKVIGTTKILKKTEEPEEQKIKLEKVDDKTAYENLLVKYAELEGKIADIKANCDLAIEGRNIKIKELEKENERLRGDLELWESGGCRATNLFKCGVAKELREQLTKAKEIINRFILWNYGCCDIPDYKDIVKQAEQFLKEIEK